MRCKLTRIVSEHRNLRTGEIEGGCDFHPEVGEPFRMLAPPLDPTKHVRLIETTPILTILELEDGAIEFSTESSRYKWERLDNAADPGA